MMRACHPSALCAALAGLLLAGCAQTPYLCQDRVKHFQAPDLDARAIRRVVVVPFDHAGHDQQAVHTVTQAFAQKLQELARFEVIYQPDATAAVDEEAKLWEKGQINLAVLSKAAAAFQADAFVFGTITRYQPFDPPVLGLKVCMATASDGEVVWQADGVFDAKTAEVADAVKHYFKKRYKRDRHFYGWEMMLVSMPRYSEFVCEVVVASLGPP